jgi:hypothetical protein
MLMTQREIEGLMAQVNKAFETDRNRIADLEVLVKDLHEKYQELDSDTMKKATVRKTAAK